MRKAFSLLELSIVIVIIAIILSASLNIRNITSNYEIRHVMSELNNYKNIFEVFYNIYKDIPGDINRGYKLFGDKNCTNHINSAIYNQGCNGNHNQKINSKILNSTDGRESILAWYHLYQAELIKFNNNNDMNLNNKNVIGGNRMQCNNATVQHIGYNIPMLKIRRVGILIDQYNLLDNGYFQISFVVKKGIACEVKDYLGVFNIMEIEGIDRKYDNENINSGNIKVTNSECNDSFNKSKKDKICDLQYNTIINRN